LSTKSDIPKGYHFYRGLEWADKAGGYAIQGRSGALFVSRIDGDYYNVVGLPLGRLYRELRGTYTIVETKKVKEVEWGRLKSGAGWICLTNTKRV